MSGEPLPGRTAATLVPGLSPWMVRRETHVQHQGLLWTAAAAMSVAVGLLNPAWLWLPMTVIATRGALTALTWVRVAAARRPCRGQVDARVVAAVPKGALRRHPSTEATRYDDEELLVGYLEATRGGWSWRPRLLASGHFLHLDLPNASIQAATWSPTHQPGMPPASYLRIRTHTGLRYDFLVWDHLRLPPLAPHRETTPQVGDLPG